MSLYEPPLADLDTALPADLGWAPPHIMKAGFLLSLTEPRLLSEANAHLSHARVLGDGEFGSSEESVGEFWLWKPAEHVIQSEFGDPEHPIAVRFSQGDFGFVLFYFGLRESIKKPLHCLA